MATATQQAKSNMESGFFERLGDRFNAFVEGCVSIIARIMGGSSNERRIKNLGYIRPKGAEAHTVTPGLAAGARSTSSNTKMQALTDDELKGLSVKFRERLAKGETLDDLLPEAFAACREAARRTKNMRHFDVQIVGGVVLHRGNIAEMVTGEGKTLVATLPAYLNALERQGRPRRHGQRLPRPPRLRVDAAHLPRARRHRRLHPDATWTRTTAARPTTATSPTAPTASSASTTCATT